MEISRSVILLAYNAISPNRSIGYSISSAVADINDNSITANVQNIEIFASSLKEELMYPY